MKSFIYIMGVALLLVFCSCEKQGEQEQGTQRTEQGQGEKPKSFFTPVRHTSNG